MSKLKVYTTRFACLLAVFLCFNFHNFGFVRYCNDNWCYQVQYPKMRKNIQLFSLVRNGSIQYKARTGITAEKIIFILLAFQKVFLGVTALCISYRPLGGFFVFCISDIVLCVVITPILYSLIITLVTLPTAFSIFEHSTKKREVQ